MWVDEAKVLWKQMWFYTLSIYGIVWRKKAVDEKRETAVMVMPIDCLTRLTRSVELFCSFESLLRQ